MQDRENIEAIYSLTPLQQGILFHTLYAESGVEYFDQVSCTLAGDLDPAALKATWEDLLARHPVLRTAVVWEDLEEPVQVVLRRVELPWEELDWRGMAGGEVEARFAALRQRDLCGFDLGRAPLLRLTLVRTGEAEYRFLWSRHHLILDAWSAALLLAEMGRLYAAHRAGERADLPLPRPFRDFVARVAQRDAAAEEGHWRRALAGLRQPTPLAIEAPGRAGPGAAPAPVYADRVRRLDAATTAALGDGARRLGVTLNTLVQGAWAILLGRYAGTRDVVFGSVEAGRPADLDGVGSMVGLFLNTLPVRARWSTGETVAAFLRRLQDEQAAQREYTASSLIEIQGWSDVPRSLPLFESLYVFENYPVARNAAGGDLTPGLEIRDVDTTSNRTGYPWALAVEPRQEMALRVTYDRQRFPAAAVERALAHLETLALGMAEEPRRRLADLPWLTPRDRAAEAAANDTARDYGDAGLTLHGAISAQAERTPGAMAVLAEGAELTYAELDRRADRLAHRLRAAGARRGTRVAVCAERSPALVVALVAVLKAGAAYVPVEPGQPADRRRAILADAAPAVLLADPPYAADLEGLEGGVEPVSLEGAADAADGTAPGPPPGGAGPDDPAYVIYTSGSTGRPKGVVNAHRAVRNRLAWMQDAYRLGAGDTVLQKTPFGFDVSVWEFFWPLAEGARLAVARPGGHKDTAYLVEAIRRFDVNVLHFVPSMLQLFLEAGDPDPGGRLRLVVLSGEALPRELMERAVERLAPARVENLYGPTEAAIDVTRWSCDPSRGDRVVPIGRPIANVTAHVVDRGLRPLPVAVPGELVVGGAAPAMGYLGRPARTAAAFVPDPFAAKAGARLYRTGDRVRRLEDGELEFLGRVDFQVKVRGFRVEPGEIESALAGHPGVREAVVVARDDLPGGTRLVAHVVAGEDGAAPAELREHLRSRLPEHMVPAAWEVHAALPLNASGKADRRALASRPLPGAAASADGPRTPPRDAAEEVVAQLFRQLLGVEELGVEDSFFDLGGHSLLALRLISRLHLAFGAEPALKDLFETPTVAGLARRMSRLRQQAVGTGGAAVEPVEPVSRDRDLPLSFAQRRLWFLDQLQPGSPFYNIPAAYLFDGPLSVPALEQTLSEVVRRHEVLRTHFASRGGEAVQVVGPPSPVALPRVDLSGLAGEEREPEARRLAASAAGRPFDLATGPLIRCALMRLRRGGDGEEARHAAVFVLHHIVADQWSLEILVEEVGRLYQAFTAGRPSPLTEPAVQYADFAAWQRRRFDGDGLQGQLAYWRRQLADLPDSSPLAAEGGGDGGAASTGDGSAAGIVTFSLPPSLAAAVRELSRRHGVTLYMTLLAALQTLLHRLSGRTDLAVGTPVAGRHRREVEGLIGCFINNLVLRGDLAGNPTFGELLGRTRGTVLDAFAHQDLPFERLVAELRPERDAGGPSSPLFQVAFGVQNREAVETGFGAVRTRPLPLPPVAARYDLTLWMMDRGPGEGIDGRWIFRRGLLRQATVERFGDSLGALLAHAAEAPGTRLDALRLESDEERRQRGERQSAASRKLGRGLKRVRRRAVSLAELPAPATAETATPETAPEMEMPEMETA